MLRDELFHILKGNRDHVDTQFRNNLNLLVERATHEALVTKSFVVPSKEQQSLCSLLLWAYYRRIYLTQGRYGGLIIVVRDQISLLWLGNLLRAVLGLRDVEIVDLDAKRLCPAMRDNREAAGYSKSRIIHGLPFEGMMSWDINNLTACCNLSESIVLTMAHPSTWSVSATKKGEVARLEDLMDEVFDLSEALAELKKQ
jgi:hypothetical protein